jgi:hypothetical protein
LPRRRRLPPQRAPALISSLADLVRGDELLWTIERALESDYSDDIRKRDLQLEAKAHMAVQQWIDPHRDQQTDQVTFMESLVQPDRLRTVFSKRSFTAANWLAAMSIR